MYSASNAFLSLRYRTVFQYDVFCVTVLKAKDFPIPIFYLFIYLFICLFIYVFIYLFIYLFIYFCVAFSTKNRAIAIIFLSLFFPTANLNRPTKVICRILYICWARKVWLNSDRLEKRSVTNIFSNLKFRVKNYAMCFAMPCFAMLMAEAIGHISKHVKVIIFFEDVNSGRDFTESYHCFL